LHLRYEELFKCLRVCRTWQALLKENASVWSKAYYRDWMAHLELQEPDTTDKWQHVFKQVHGMLPWRVIENNDIKEVAPILCNVLDEMKEAKLKYLLFFMDSRWPKNDTNFTALWFYAKHSKNAKDIYQTMITVLKTSKNFKAMFFKSGWLSQTSEALGNIYQSTLEHAKYVQNLLDVDFAFLDKDHKPEVSKLKSAVQSLIALLHQPDVFKDLMGRLEPIITQYCPHSEIKEVVDRFLSSQGM